MKRLFSFIAVLGCIVFLTGCHTDMKQAANIQEKIEESVSYEKKFVANQEKLETYQEKEQSIYNHLLELDIQDTDTIQNKIEDGHTYLNKQETLLKEAKGYFRKAYQKSYSIKENVAEIKDNKQKKQASELLDIMAKRKKVMDTFFNDYQGQLKLLNAFYDRFEDEDLKADEMDEQIDQMNENNEAIEDIAQTFNDDTKAYNETKTTYYKMVDAD